jgi:hypothetical protein
VTNAGRLISGGGFDVLVQIDWKFIVYTDLPNARSSAKTRPAGAAYLLNDPRLASTSLPLKSRRIELNASAGSRLKSISCALRFHR